MELGDLNNLKDSLYQVVTGIEEIEKSLDDLRPKGEWVDGYDGIPVCSKCSNGYNEQPRNKNGKPVFRYCPSCGARMKGVL